MDKMKNNAQNMYNSRKGSDCNPNIGIKPMGSYNIPNSIGGSKPSKRLNGSKACK